MGRKRVALIASGCVVALVVAAMVVVGVVNGSRGPKEAVQAYLDLIARGDAAGATAMVDPGSVDRTLLTNDVLGSATDRIVVTEVFAMDEDAAVGETVEVSVRYTLGDAAGSVDLHAKREPNSSLFVEQWRVVDPFLVQVAVETTVPTLDTAFLGVAKVPATADKQPQRPVTVYPGVYPLKGVTSKHLKTTDGKLVADSSRVNRPATVVKAQVNYEATPELSGLVEGKMAEYVAACTAANAPHCPSGLGNGHLYGRDLRVLRAPTLERLQVYQLTYRPDGTAEPAIRFFTRRGECTYVSTESGSVRHSDFGYAGAVDIAPDDTVTVTFDGTY